MLINSHICSHQFSFIQPILTESFILCTRDQHYELNKKLNKVWSYSPLRADSVGRGRTAHRLCERSVASSVRALCVTQGNVGSGVPAPVYRGLGKVSGEKGLLELDL